MTLSTITEFFSVVIGLCGTWTFTKKHWSAPLLMVVAYSIALVFNMINRHYITSVITVVKIGLSLRTVWIWIKDK